VSTVQDDASKGAAPDQGAAPWWADHWYRPGLWSAVSAGVIFAVAPWAGDNAARWSGTAFAVLGIGLAISLVYGLRSMYHDERSKAVQRAEQEVRHEWEQEARWDHCETHCGCAFCQTRRNQKRQAITT